MLKRIAYGLGLLLIPFGVLAATQADLLSEIAAQLATNTSGQITAAKLRTVLNDIVNHFGAVVPIDPVVDYGADPTGVADATTAFNQAAATGKPVRCSGTFKITNIVTLANSQDFGGNNRGTCILNVPATFNMSALGVLRAGTSEPGATIHDLKIVFAQPSAITVSGDVVHFPPAIFAQNTPRFRVRNVTIMGAYVGIDMRGNSGGAELDGVDESSFFVGTYIDGALDNVRINRYSHSGIFLPNYAGQATYFNASSSGIVSARCDGLILSNVFFFGGIGVTLQTGAGATYNGVAAQPGPTFGTASNMSVDSFSGLFMTSGLFSISSLYTSQIAGGGGFPVYQTGGDLTIASGESFNDQTAFPAITAAGGTLEVNTFNFDTAAHDVSAIAASGGADVTVMGSRFSRTTNIAYTVPTISVTGTGTLATVSGNKATPKGTGSGTFMNFAVDAGHRAMGNRSPGWTNTVASGAMGNSLTATAGGGVYAGN